MDKDTPGVRLKLLQNVGKGGNEDLKLRPDLAVNSATKGRYKGGVRLKQQPILRGVTQITGQSLKRAHERSLNGNNALNITAFYHYGHSLSYAQSRSILFLLIQSSPFVVNNDLGSTLEARRWGGCSYDPLKFVTPADGKTRSKTLKSTQALCRGRRAGKISQDVVEKDR